MSHSFYPPKNFQRSLNFKRAWSSAHHTVKKGQPLDEIIQSIKILESNSIFSNEIIIVYRTQDLRPLYVSKNVKKVLGYTQEEYLNWGESALFKIGAFNQPTFYSNLVKWKKDIQENSPYRDSEIIGRSHYCGVNYLHKNGSVCSFMMRRKVVIGKNMTSPEFGIVYLEDISHLIKGNDYWVLYELNSESGNYSKFCRKDGIDAYPITAREKEVLVLVAKGKSTKEVALELNISPDTVGQHRKNMIRKMMAKDTSALIQLCKICDII